MTCFSEDIKITVIGPGAIGSLLSAFLFKAGARITLLDYRPERAKRIDEHGIHVKTKLGSWYAHPKILEGVSKACVQDLVILAVKTYQTRNAIKGAGPLIGPQTIVASIQNGIGIDKDIEKMCPDAPIALGTTSQGATLVKWGTVVHAGTGPTYLGLIKGDPGNKAVLLALAKLLKKAGWPCEIVQDIRPYIWKKLIINVGINALTALTGLRNGELLHHQETLETQKDLVIEGLQVAKALGVAFEIDDQQALELVKQVCRNTAENISSMLQDRLKGRPTEIDYINGAICKMGTELGIHTPCNQIITRLVRLCSRTCWKNAK